VRPNENLWTPPILQRNSNAWCLWTDCTNLSGLQWCPSTPALMTYARGFLVSRTA